MEQFLYRNLVYTLGSWNWEKFLYVFIHGKILYCMYGPILSLILACFFVLDVGLLLEELDAMSMHWDL